MGYSERDAAGSVAGIYQRTGQLKLPGPPGHFESPEGQAVLRSRSEKERRKTRRRKAGSRSDDSRRGRERTQNRESLRGKLRRDESQHRDGGGTRMARKAKRSDSRI